MTKPLTDEEVRKLAPGTKLVRLHDPSIGQTLPPGSICIFCARESESIIYVQIPNGHKENRQRDTFGLYNPTLTSREELEALYE